MKLLAIDPGLQGGIAVFDGPRLIAVDRMKVWKTKLMAGSALKRQVDVATLREVIGQHDIEQIVTEYQTAMPGQSSVATATTFLNWGLILGLRLFAPVAVVHPRIWKRHFGLGSFKKLAIAKALHLFPSLGTNVPSDGVAEAVLIGQYWLEKGSAIAEANARKASVKPRRAPRRRASSGASARSRPSSGTVRA